MDIGAVFSAAEKAVKDLESHDEEVRAQLVQLGQQLVAMCGRVDTSGESAEFTIDGVAEDDYVRGHLSVSPGGCYFAYRSSDQDIFETDAYARDMFRLMPLAQLPVRWLRAAATPEHVRELVESVAKNARDTYTSRDGMLAAMRSAGEAPASHVADSLAASAAEMGFPRVIDDWNAAIREVHVNPSGALTAACTMVETTLKHILARLNQQLPSDQSIQPLYKSVSKTLKLSPDEAGTVEVRAMLQGASTIVVNLGTLRSKLGDAHGKAPSQRAASIDEARMSVNFAGTICTFLIRRLAEQQAELNTKP